MVACFRCNGTGKILTQKDVGEVYGRPMKLDFLITCPYCKGKKHEEDDKENPAE